MIMMRDGGAEQKMVLVVVISFNVCTATERSQQAAGKNQPHSSQHQASVKHKFANQFYVCSL